MQTRNLVDVVGERDYLADEVLTGSLAPGERLTGVDFVSCTFDGGQFESAAFERCTFEDCSFVRANLSRANLLDSRLVGSSFEHCKMLALNLSVLGVSPLADPVRFEDCRMDLSICRDADLAATTFRRCSLREVDFGGANLRGADFAGSDLTGATFNRSDLRDARLLGAHGYRLDVRDNQVRGLVVEAHEAAGLLQVLGLDVR